METARDGTQWKGTNDWRAVARGGILVPLPVGFMELADWSSFLSIINRTKFDPVLELEVVDRSIAIDWYLIDSTDPWLP